MVEVIRALPSSPDLDKSRALSVAAEEALVRLGHCLNVLRRTKRLTQKQLAERSGIDQASISEIENADANPTVRTLGRIAAALEVDISELVVEEHNPADEMQQPTVIGFIDGDVVMVPNPAFRPRDAWYHRRPTRRSKVKAQGEAPSIDEVAVEAFG